MDYGLENGKAGINYTNTRIEKVAVTDSLFGMQEPYAAAAPDELNNIPRHMNIRESMANALSYFSPSPSRTRRDQTHPPGKFTPRIPYHEMGVNNTKASINAVGSAETDHKEPAFTDKDKPVVPHRGSTTPHQNH